MSEHSIVDFFSLYDRVNEFLASEQRKYAKNLIRTKHELGLNQKQMAILSGKPYEGLSGIGIFPVGSRDWRIRIGFRPAVKGDGCGHPTSDCAD